MADLTSVYRDKSPSAGTKVTLAVVHLGIVLVVLWLLLGGGIAVADRALGIGHHAGSGLRRGALAAAAALYFLRTLVTSFVFVRRRMPWSEVATIAVWIGIIDLLFAYLGGRNPAPAGTWTAAGGLLVVLGSGLNTGSEWQRHAWKRHPEHRGHLFKDGLFRWSRHVNYFGDVVLFTGWAILTGRPALLAVPAVMIALFALVNVPAQDRYLRERYGEEYESYAGRTARLIPLVY